MNTRDLEAFMAVVEAGSIIRASARLNLTQPGVTRRIQVLEDSLGVTLLDRQSKPLKPTADGILAYEHGRRILGGLEDLKTDLSSDGDIRGELRIGVTPYLSEVALGIPLDRLRKEFPKLKLCIVAGWPERLLEKMRRGEIDAAALYAPEGIDPSCEFEGDTLGVHRLAIVAPKNAALASAVSLRDLAHFSWVLNQDGCGVRSAIRRRFDQEGLALRIGIEAVSSELRLSLVARGLGLTLSTKRAVTESASRDKLKTVTIPGFEPKVGAWIIHRPAAGRLVSPIGCFKEALREGLADE